MSAPSELVVASIARALNAAQIPCVLWGHPLLIVHGVPSIIARLILWFRMIDGDTCPKSPEQRYTPPPAFHIHIKATEVATVFPPWRPDRGAGVFKSAQDPVIAPRSHILLEAFLRLYARDVGKRTGSFGMAMIAYMEEYVDDDGFLDSSLLPEPLNAFYKELRVGDKPVRQWTKELMGALGVPDEDSDDDLY
ncbi:hypothetical protein TOPH_07815 [Tolypocladium ophioglossoides CBS 100239]|uniref:Uncharacterized protein n=1 Tax=Tolypocladium ophioglossoides (strain CBS 100239) TaxID=1163406 RepID=A0A0L0N0B2_TOLOC|nr:hypothetical protein TOPH_07815 [Tolypocladium ophioglossoides CBS 100239]